MAFLEDIPTVDHADENAEPFDGDHVSGFDANDGQAVAYGVEKVEQARRKPGQRLFAEIPEPDFSRESQDGKQANVESHEEPQIEKERRRGKDALFADDRSEAEQKRDNQHKPRTGFPKHRLDRRQHMPSSGIDVEDVAADADDKNSEKTPSSGNFSQKQCAGQNHECRRERQIRYGEGQGRLPDSDHVKKKRNPVERDTETKSPPERGLNGRLWYHRRRDQEHGQAVKGGVAKHMICGAAGEKTLDASILGRHGECCEKCQRKPVEQKNHRVQRSVDALGNAMITPKAWWNWRWCAIKKVVSKISTAGDSPRSH